MAHPPALGRFGVCFLAGQVAFVLLMLCCIGIEPSALAVRRGLSYYGNHVVTLAPYLAAYGACISLTALGLRGIAATGDAGRLRRALVAMLGLMVGVALTPYSVDLLLDWLHIAAATLLFTAGYGVAVWLTFALLRNACAFALLAALSVAGVAIAAGQAGLLAYMIPGEFAFQVIFAALLLETSRRRRQALGLFVAASA